MAFEERWAQNKGNSPSMCRDEKGHVCSASPTAVKSSGEGRPGKRICLDIISGGYVWGEIHHLSCRATKKGLMKKFGGNGTTVSVDG